VKAYRFRLASVARIRAIEERLCRDRLMTSLRDLRRARESEHAAKVAMAAFEAPTGEITIGEVIWAGDQAERLAESVRARHQAVTVAEAASIEARRAWNAAAKRSGVLDRLDEQARARWRDEVMRAESAELDDLANGRHGLAGAGR
jgi:hypothetical protein